MNLLPKTHDEFSQPEYWNTFFKKCGKKSFEWYGEYSELCDILIKYIKIKDDILVVGCGNSTLSMSLYDVGYRNIINIDVSEVVIKQMQNINKNDKPDLIYEQMDATQMTYPDEKFSVILDKGTLDALMPNVKEDTISIIDKYFKEIIRVLRNGGRYICISLLQEHILRKILSYFTANNFMIRVTRCHKTEEKAKQEEGSSIPVFVVVATKFIKLTESILEIALTDGKPERVSSTDTVISAVLSVQQSALICNCLDKRSISDVGEICLDLHRVGDKYPRYTVYVLDQPRAKGAKSYAAFIVPQGKETDWLFSTKEGRQQILQSTRRDRLTIVTLRREHKFESWDAVKTELGDCVRNLAPSALPDKSHIPYLSLDTDIGARTICFEGESKISGSFVVEETEEDEHTLRRLIFLNNPYVIQSEARLKEVKSRRGKKKKVIDNGFLACKHHVYMSIGVSMILDSTNFNEIMIIGLGGGGLCTFLYHCFSNLKITTVEIDEAILKVAVEHFGLTLDNRMQVQIADGIEFIKNSASEGKKYSAILFDVDSKDTTVGMSCPPKQFLEIDLLKMIASCLTENGLFILNLVSRDSTLKQKAKDDLKSIFVSVVSYTLQDYVNDVIMCSINTQESKEWKNKIKKAVVNLNEQAIKRKVFVSSDAFDVSSLVKNLSIES
ncbi:eEF1A lysine and N-terminal methyltransferase homolog isoform X1 [Vespa velutina]|uniref:eEF1A lysine and N-terminal methyltransferase homolog isoform X1 n=2 Tax=Vespa velutina TaxID=202808 RepID=UPI001FB3C6B9|nr:eEF1A lysine and N-terminal methyltransferase homolog isoform X1 [Vespa velutina]